MAKKSATLVIGVLVILSASVLASEVHLPEGEMPKVDGIFSDEEWSDSLRLPLRGGRDLFAKRSGEYLCIGMQGASGGIGSLGLGVGDSIRILHASTGLITAGYKKSENMWVTGEGFRGPEVQPGVEYPRGEIRQSDQYRQANLSQFGWTANVVELGPPEEMEYIVRIGEAAGQRVWLSVVFFQIKAEDKYAVAPEALSDASLDKELIAGTAKAELKFEPSQWLSVVW